jgi:hypothetical protein
MPKTKPAETPIEEEVMTPETETPEAAKRIRRSYDKLLFEVDEKIEYHQNALAKLQAKRARFVDYVEGRAIHKGGKPLSEESRALMEKFSALTPEEIEARRLAAQREANVLARLAKKA